MLKILVFVGILPLSFCMNVHASVSCNTVLSSEKINFNFEDTLLRSPELIRDPIENAEALKAHKYGVVPNRVVPVAREQCMGTCYIYSSAIAVENALKIQGDIPEAGLMLIAPIIAKMAVDKVEGKYDFTSIDLSTLLSTGFTETFHAITDQSVFFLTPGEIEKFKSSRNILDLEAAFIKEFIQEQTFLFNGKKFIEHLKKSPSQIQALVIAAFKSFLNTSLDIQGLPISGITYEFMDKATIAKVGDVRLVTGLVDTYGAKATAFENVTFNILTAAMFGQHLTPSYHVFSNDDKKDIIVSVAKRILNGDFVKVGLDESIFTEGHAVLLTNVVIDPETNKLVGFKYLNSHGVEFGEEGYGYIGASELFMHITGYEAVDAVVISE